MYAGLKRIEIVEVLEIDGDMSILYYWSLRNMIPCDENKIQV